MSRPAYPRRRAQAAPPSMTPRVGSNAGRRRRSAANLTDERLALRFLELAEAQLPSETFNRLLQIAEGSLRGDDEEGIVMSGKCG